MKTEKPISYIFVLAEKHTFSEIKKRIIKEIEDMPRLNITGRRIFKLFGPDRVDTTKTDEQYKNQPYPPSRSYSYLISHKKNGEQFDWKKEFDL